MFSPYGETLFGDPAEPPTSKLGRDFTIPPFTVLDTKLGQWQNRRRAWLAHGIKSELGRTAAAFGTLSTNLAGGAYGDDKFDTDTSIFDPVLCELSYRWFCPPAGTILDPFAGGSVRGIVAGALGYNYTGVDLSIDQVAANIVQAETIGPTVARFVTPDWIVGDSYNVAHDLHTGGYEADLVFTCPPYADLEVYSDDPSDLSYIAKQDYHAFISRYRHIIARSIRALADNRFAVIVVGDVRDKKGFYRNFVSDTISAFQDAGAAYYNEAILVNSVGTLPIRVGNQFRASRKLGKQHQNVLVFVKGDPKLAAAAIGNNRGDTTTIADDIWPTDDNGSNDGEASGDHPHNLPGQLDIFGAEVPA